jgi:membrane-bound serine protease (ClpP class)
MFAFGTWGWSLLLAGVTVVGLEILIPSAGLLTLTALALLAGGGWCSVQHGGTSALIGYTLTALVLGPCSALMALRVLPKTPMGRKMMLRGPSTSASPAERSATEAGLSELVGTVGIATTSLRPVGIATLNERRVDVVSRGSHLDAGARVRVVKVEGNRVIVEPAGDLPAA